MRKAVFGLQATLWLTALAAMGGCATTQPDARQGLREAYRELDGASPDVARILTSADAYLTQQPAGPDAADAYYLRGRAFEAKGQVEPSATNTDLAQAQLAYRQALARQPRPALEGLAHAGLGNTLFFQDQHAQAMAEFALATPLLDRNLDKAWATFRIGVCQQRLAQWAQADQTFATVIGQYPGTEPARQAYERYGFKGFFVQVASYLSDRDATNAIAELKKLGQPAVKYQDKSRTGPFFVRVGPLASHDGATMVRQQLASRYKDAIIVP